MEEERNELPLGWVWATVGDLVVEAQPGFASGKKGVEGGIRHLRMNNIGPDCMMNLSNVITVPGDLAKERHLLKLGDVLFCHTNSQKLVGKTALFKVQDGPYAYSNHLTRLRLYPEGPLPEWLSYALAALWRDRYFETRCKQWVNQATVERDTLLSTPIPLAPLNEQRRIIAKIEALFEESRATRRALDRISPLLKKFRQAVLAATFRGYLTRDWREQHSDVEPASVLLEGIRAERHRRYHEEAKEAKAKGRRPPRKPDNIDPPKLDPSRLGALASGWQWTTINDLSEGSRGITYGVIKLGSSHDPGIPTLRSSDVRWLHIDLSSVKRINPEIANRYQRTFLHGGEVLVTVRGSLGGVACVPTTCKGFNVSREVAVVAPVPEINAEWLTYVIGSPKIQNVLTAVARGVAYTGVNIEDLKQIAIPVPPVSEQARIVAQIEVLFARADAIEAALEAALRRADRLEQSILGRAFRGELVPQDPNDEPASALLERISVRG